MSWWQRDEAAMVNPARDAFLEQFRAGVLTVNEVRVIEDIEPLPPAKCEYCGRYGGLGNCEGCGAPNKPVRWIDVTTYGDVKRRYVEGL